MILKKLLDKKIVIWGIAVLLLIVVAIATVIIVFDVRKQNYIDDLNTKIADIYSSFESAEGRADKYSILEDFISSAESYSKYDENKENHTAKVNDMKAALLAGYETELTKNTVTIYEETTKEELNTLVTTLSSLKTEIETDEITGTENVISKIDTQIKIYKDKIAEIEAAEKAEAERLKKEAEEKAKQEAEAAAAKKAAESKVQNTNNNSSSSNSSDNSSNSASNNSSSSNNSNFDSSGMTKSWDTTEDGTEIEGTTTYHDNNGNVYDENGNYLGNLNEWAWDW